MNATRDSDSGLGLLGGPVTPPDLRRPGGFLAVVGKVTAILKITLAARLTYLGEQLIRTSFLVLILYTFTQLWSATNQTQDVALLTGFTVAQLIWYLAFTEAIMTSSVGIRENEVDREVRSGDLAYRIARPLSYPAYHLGTYLGERVLRFFTNLMVAALVSLVVVGPIGLRPDGVALAILAALLAFLADWVWTFAISLGSFWVEDTFGIHLLYRRFLMILGGMLIPLDAYPQWLGDIARALPFQYLVYHPGRLFVSRDPTGWPTVLAAQIAIAGIGLLPLLLLYRLGLRRVSSQGG